MDLTLNRDVMNVELSGIRQFTYLVRDTPGACALTIGEPDLNTPDVIKEAAKAALDDNDTHYPPGNGYPYALEAISRFEAEAHGLRYAPSEIILTVGATEALFAAFSTILNAGDDASLGGFCIRAVKSFHSDPMAVGLIISADGKTVYFSGDTLYDAALHKEILGASPQGIDAAFVCINGKLGNMNWCQAACLVREISAARAMLSNRV